MKILLVNDYGFGQGGAELWVVALRDDLRARGHDARLFCSDAGLMDRQASAADYQCFGTVSWGRTLLQTANPWAVERLREVLAEFRPDVVHLNIFLTQLSPLILPLLRDVPCVFHAHWQRAVCPTGTRLLPNGEICRDPAGFVCLKSGCLPIYDWIPLMIQMSLWRRWRGAVDLVVANSQATRRRLEEAGFRDVEVVYYSVPDVGCRPPLADPPTVGFAGRLVREKGVDTLLRAFARVRERVPSAQLRIAGRGPEEEALRGLATKLGLDGSVKFSGWVSSTGLEALLAPVWVQTVPSAWEEAFGLVALEAARRGTASVVSDLGGLAEIVVEGETGFRVRPRDVDSWAQVLTRLLADRELAERMGNQARADAAVRFPADEGTSRMVQIYQRLIEAKASERARSIS